MDLEIWGIGTTRAMRAHWVALELGLDYECHAIGSRSGETKTAEYTRLNPKQKIPVLQHGDLVLSESAAIVQYLTETYPTPPDFFVPANAAERAKLNEWCFFIMMELDAHTLYVMRRHDGLKEIYGAAPVAVDSAREYFLKYLDAMTPRIEGPYVMGEKFSVADVLLMTCLDWALAYDIALPPAIMAYRDHVARRPAYQRALRVTYPDRFTAQA